MSRKMIQRNPMGGGKSAPARRIPSQMTKKPTATVDAIDRSVTEVPQSPYRQSAYKNTPRLAYSGDVVHPRDRSGASIDIIQSGGQHGQGSRNRENSWPLRGCVQCFSVTWRSPSFLQIVYSNLVIHSIGVHFTASTVLVAGCFRHSSVQPNRSFWYCATLVCRRACTVMVFLS